MTFSIVARCADTKMLGIAISSSSPAVAARCVHTRAQIGAVSSQNITDPLLGPKTLDLMAKEQPARTAVKQVVHEAEFIEYRQIVCVDSAGRTAIFSGSYSLGICGEVQTDNAASAGNLLANSDIPQHMVDQFCGSRGHLGDRLILALQAGLDAGGEAGDLHSAGMQIVGDLPWPIVDLRCDWDENCPITALRASWEVYRPQIDDYIQRACNPHSAPSFGVPGDE